MNLLAQEPARGSGCRDSLRPGNFQRRHETPPRSGVRTRGREPAQSAEHAQPARAASQTRVASTCGGFPAGASASRPPPPPRAHGGSDSTREASARGLLGSRSLTHSGGPRRARRLSADPTASEPARPRERVFPASSDPPRSDLRVCDAAGRKGGPRQRTTEPPSLVLPWPPGQVPSGHRRPFRRAAGRLDQRLPAPLGSGAADTIPSI